MYFMLKVFAYLEVTGIPIITGSGIPFAVLVLSDIVS